MGLYIKAVGREVEQYKNLEDIGIVLKKWNEEYYSVLKREHYLVCAAVWVRLEQAKA